MVIAGYRVERDIGQGGMATVYLAIQESLNRPVALKVMAPALAADRNFSERLLREARIVGKLNHPHIVSVYDVGVVDRIHYIAMEYVDGGDLKQRQQSGQIPVDEALTIISQIAMALGYAHSKGLVHRDIKPENILFREDGSAVLTDFGIAKAVDSSTRMTGAGMSIGTPHYMSPEQAQGKQKLDGRSDLYSLGIVFYEMLTGKVPYEADNTIGVAMQHVQAAIPEFPNNYSKYQPLLDHLLAKQPGQRYQSATELIMAIDQLQSGTHLQRPVHATQVMASAGMVSPSTATNISSRSDGLKWGLGGAFLAAVIAAGLYVWQQSQMIHTITGGEGTTVSKLSELSTATSSSQADIDNSLEQVLVQPQKESKAQEIPKVTNFDWHQENDEVILVFDLEGPAGTTAEILFDMSLDRGKNWRTPKGEVTGDIGTGILTGIDKRLVWDARGDFPEGINIRDIELRVETSVERDYMPGLTVEATPSDAIIKILNTDLRYRPGIELRSGRYHVEVSRKGYKTHRVWVELKDGDRRIAVVLENTDAQFERDREAISGTEKSLLGYWCFSHAQGKPPRTKLVNPTRFTKVDFSGSKRKWIHESCNYSFTFCKSNSLGHVAGNRKYDAYCKYSLDNSGLMKRHCNQIYTNINTGNGDQKNFVSYFSRCD